MREEYGEDVELPAREKVVLPKEENTTEKKSQWEVFQNHTDFEGGFMRDDGAASGGGFVPERAPQTAQQDYDTAGGFLSASQDDPEHGDLTIDHGEKKDVPRVSVADSTYRTPISLTQALQQPPSESGGDSDDDADDDMDAPQAQEDEQIEEDEEEEVNPKATRRKPTATASARGRGRPRGRGAKTATVSARKRKSKVIDSGSDDDALSDAPSDPPTPPPSTRSAPRRKAARKSDAQVKSHFFAEGSDDETDMTDMTERNSPRKKAATRGRGSGKGRGTGRGRGRAGKAK
jgi:xeroderma pigmentosum group C-complementing protein